MCSRLDDNLWPSGKLSQVIWRSPRRQVLSSHFSIIRLFRDLIERIVLNGPEDNSSMDRMKTHGTEASDILLRKNSLNDESDGLQEPPRDMILIKNRLRRSISRFKCGCGFKLSIDSVDMAVNQRGNWRIIAHSNKTNFGHDYFPIHVELCK